jgi:hypothetical protein
LRYLREEREHSVVIGEVVASQLIEKNVEPLLMKKTGWFHGG